MSVTTPEPVVLDPCQIAPGPLTTAPDCAQVVFGRLYPASTLLPMPLHGENGVTWEPGEPCTAGQVEAYCPACTTPGDPKTFHDGAALASAVPFTAYGSFKCSGPGWSTTRVQNRAVRALAAGEQWRTEREFISTLRDLDTVDLTPGSGAVSLVAGLAALEQLAAETMVCVPAIHVPRGTVVAFPFGSVIREDGLRLRTALGSSVVAGSGYDNRGPDGSLPPVGEWWLFASAPAVIFRGEIIRSGTGSVVDTSNNDLKAFAERPMAVGRVCPDAFAIRVAIA